MRLVFCSKFLNSVLTNCEAWYGLTLKDITYLEQVDEILLRKLLEAPSSSPKCMLYLETGCNPIRFIIKMRRIMFLQYILKEDEDTMDINGGSGGGITKSDILNLIFFPMVFTHKVRMKAP